MLNININGISIVKKCKIKLNNRSHVASHYAKRFQDYYLN